MKATIQEDRALTIVSFLDLTRSACREANKAFDAAARRYKKALEDFPEDILEVRQVQRMLAEVDLEVVATVENGERLEEAQTFEKIAANCVRQKARRNRS